MVNPTGLPSSVTNTWSRWTLVYRSFLWGPVIQIRYQRSDDTHYLLVGPSGIYRDSEIFVRYQRDLLDRFKEAWPEDTLIVKEFETIPNTKIIYDNTCTALEG